MLSREPSSYLQLAEAAERAEREAQTMDAKSSWRLIANAYKTLAVEKVKQLRLSISQPTGVKVHTNE
jgi:hypothetical protein